MGDVIPIFGHTIHGKLLTDNTEMAASEAAWMALIFTSAGSQTNAS